MHINENAPYVPKEIPEPRVPSRAQERSQGHSDIGRLRGRDLGRSDRRRVPRGEVRKVRVEFLAVQ